MHCWVDCVRCWSWQASGDIGRGKMTFKKLFSICIFVLAAGAGWSTCSSAMAPDPEPEPTVSADVTPVRVASTPTAIALPAPTGEPVRVRFERGSYGATLTGTNSRRYLLWAKAGQVFKAAMIGTGYSSLYSADGATLYEQAPAGAVVRVTLKLDGDQMLEVRSSGQYTIGVEIR